MPVKGCGCVPKTSFIKPWLGVGHGLPTLFCRAWNDHSALLPRKRGMIHLLSATVQFHWLFLHSDSSLPFSLHIHRCSPKPGSYHLSLTHISLLLQSVFPATWIPFLPVTKFFPLEKSSLYKVQSNWLYGVNIRDLLPIILRGIKALQLYASKMCPYSLEICWNCYSRNPVSSGMCFNNLEVWVG